VQWKEKDFHPIENNDDDDELKRYRSVSDSKQECCKVNRRFVSERKHETHSRKALFGIRSFYDFGLSPTFFAFTTSACA
jgi:hypothetical protein